MSNGITLKNPLGIMAALLGVQQDGEILFVPVYGSSMFDRFVVTEAEWLAFMEAGAIPDKDAAQCILTCCKANLAGPSGERYCAIRLMNPEAVVFLAGEDGVDGEPNQEFECPFGLVENPCPRGIVSQQGDAAVMPDGCENFALDA